MPSTVLAPVVLFVYNRPQHTAQCLAALASNDLAEKTNLIIYADGIKKDSDAPKVAEVRKLIRQNFPFQSIKIIESIENKGLMQSIIDGVTEVIGQYGKVIVLEDDLICAKGFLRYMNDALDLYENEPHVMHISGYMFPVFKKLPETLFYQSTSCWSWATWKNRWQYFNPDAQDLYNKLQESGKMYGFDLDGSNQLKPQLEMNIQNKRHTWAVKWEASVYLRGGLCLHPGKSLVRNIGHEGSGSSFDYSGILATQALTDYIKVEKIPLKQNLTLRNRMKLYYALDGNISKKRIFYYYLKKYTFHLLPNTWKNSIKQFQKNK